jgi:alpha-L-fucosidase 2
MLCPLILKANPSLSDVEANALAGSHLIWTDQPAPKDQWSVGYAVGNGRLGATVAGNFPNERIILNEETIWQKKPRRFMPENSHALLEEIVELDRAGMYQEADTLLESDLLTNYRPSSYQLLGELRILHRSESASAAVATLRTLDLSTGLTRARWSDGQSTIEQTVYASAVDDVIVIRLDALEGAPLDFAVELSREGSQSRISETDLVVQGKASGEGTRYEGRLRFRLEGGQLSATDSGARITGAQSVCILVAAATDFNRDDVDTPLAEGWQSRAAAALDAIDGTKESELRTRAIADHQGYYERVSLELGESPKSVRAMTIPARLARIQEGATHDPDLTRECIHLHR